ncbi:uncharacterized protein Z519_05360 [Cladophialophora bantiana CBS 173.52]|uniref:UBC core domain-containing protein n=1 Tax=Cladophialophora bantiana (strain ATCC 10958 / CBS 173.52 / CDC B-1940 / NIH 8579) TaxID=1442370 RepID=A0A0D2IB62_CLAB1|nr:uncharacterized protein Z519_05360 [Cladophialophora bantiana CBS 173.52]KIW94044.1 hypothetical protein Z519_05360 [Cladophialophora bantiana CBS 173.52]
MASSEVWLGSDLKSTGPYAGAVLRFQISFSDTYPDLPPLVTFSTDVFHPLIVPLTTYTFSANSVDASGTVSASDEDRLPPGTFSLRYGFPHWFTATPLPCSKDDTFGANKQGGARHLTPGDLDSDIVDANEDPQVDREPPRDRRVTILKVLQHIQDAFEDEGLLDKLPLETVGDPSAWHAWRAHRGLARRQNEPQTPVSEVKDAAPSSPKNPGEWKWDGVWESRVRNGIEASISEATLFGSSAGGRAGSVVMDTASMDPHQRLLAAADRQIRFTKLSDEQFDKLKDEISVSGPTLPV